MPKVERDGGKNYWIRGEYECGKMSPHEKIDELSMARGTRNKDLKIYTDIRNGLNLRVIYRSVALLEIFILFALIWNNGGGVWWDHKFAQCNAVGVEKHVSLSELSGTIATRISTEMIFMKFTKTRTTSFSTLFHNSLHPKAWKANKASLPRSKTVEQSHRAQFQEIRHSNSQQ